MIYGVESRHACHRPHVHVDGRGERAQQPNVLPSNPNPPCERASINLWLITYSQKACERHMSGGCGPSAGGPPSPWASADRH
eukprot:358277-Chlamydomonas_euryale.AAC.9